MKKMKKEGFEGYPLNSKGNVEFEFNVLDDFETFTGSDKAYLIKAEIEPNSEVWESIENGYLPKEGDDGLIDINHITVSLSFLKEIYELACGKGALERPTTEDEVAKAFRKLKAENSELKSRIDVLSEIHTLAVDLLDERSFEEWREVSDNVIYKKE